MIRIAAVLGIMGASIICFSIQNSRTLSDPPAPSSKNTQPASLSIPNQEIFTELASLDNALFEAAFNTCDHQLLSNLISADFEFLHDRTGLVATNGTQFLENIRNQCERRKVGQEFRSRRELVPGTLEVFPLANFGAIQTGIHRFYILEPGQPERSGDIAKFIHVWKKSDDKWKLARVLSYDHKPAKP